MKNHPVSVVSIIRDEIVLDERVEDPFTGVPILGGPFFMW